MQALYIFIIVGGLAVAYGLLYYFNKKTPEPEGCEEINNTCAGCNITSCGRHPTHQE